MTAGIFRPYPWWTLYRPPSRVYSKRNATTGTGMLSAGTASLDGAGTVVSPPVGWPASLPQTIAWQGYARRIQDTRIRTHVASGPPKVRSRFTARVDQYDLPVHYFTKAQWGILDTFYTVTLANGTLPFDWLDPLTGGTVSYRFVSPPEFGAMLGPDTIPVTLHVEVLP